MCAISGLAPKLPPLLIHRWTLRDSPSSWMSTRIFAPIAERLDWGPCNLIRIERFPNPG